MKRTTILSAIMLFAFSLTATVQADPGNDKEEAAITQLNEKATVLAAQGQWDAFSDNLVVALKSEHDGLKAAAMGMIISMAAGAWIF